MDEIDIMAATQHQAAQDYLLLEEPEFRREMKLYLHFQKSFGYKFMMKIETTDEIVAKMLMFAE